MWTARLDEYTLLYESIMKISYTDEFCHEFKRLPNKVQTMFRKQEDLFKKDNRDPRLHTKKLSGDPTTFSFRITSSYRALFYLQTDSKIIFLTIGHRKDVYRKNN